MSRSLYSPNPFRRLLQRTTLFMLMALVASALMANDITVSNTRLVGSNGGGFFKVQFDLSWKNSWRNPFSTGINNWDAAWVFVKYREADNSSAAWSHLYLSNVAEQYAAGTWSGDGQGGAVMKPALSDSRVDGSGNQITAYSPAINGNPSGKNPVVGAFVYRGSPGRGHFVVSKMEFAFSRAENGMDINKLYDIQVFAIEMVYVPQGSFFVGSGGTEGSSFTQANSTTGPTVPFLMTSEPPTIQGNDPSSSASNLGARGAMDVTGTNTATLAAGFPTGYQAFYMMKYTITQQQWVDFLNTLTREQQNTRTETGLAAAAPDVPTYPVSNIYVMSGKNSSVGRNGIRVTSPVPGNGPINFFCDLNNNGIGGEINDGQWIAMNYISEMDGAAYMDWAGLRYTTELEYEKAARGPLKPVPNEFAWGTPFVSDQFHTVSNNGRADEGIATNYITTGVAGNANYIIPNSAQGSSPTKGPMRVGIFADNSANKGRVTSGASYWGILELSGQTYERPVHVGSAVGRQFTGLHGDGRLSTMGNANVAAWPGLSGTTGEVTFGVGSTYRGGSYNYGVTEMRISKRGGSGFTENYSQTTRIESLGGFRGGRSAGCSFDPGIPAEPQVVEDVTEVIPNRMVTLTTNLSDHTGGYFWTFASGDWKLIAGQGTPHVKVLVGSEPAVLSVGAVNDCGTGPYRTVTLESEVSATGGSEITSYIADGTNGEAGKKYIVHIFRPRIEAHTFEPREAIASVDYLIVAGGGGGGGVANPGQEASGGGGAGGLLTSFATPTGGTGVLSLSATSYSITVGAGGEAQTQGGNSTAFGLTAVGGGYGGSNGFGPSIGGNGGSGGGGSGFSGAKAGGSGIAGPPRQGYSGGTGPHTTNLSGGGGGAGSAGNSEALGGQGLTYNIIGSNLTYAAGGNGGTFNQGAASNTIGGGGGGGGRSGGANNLGTPGKDGVVIIRYKAAGN